MATIRVSSLPEIKVDRITDDDYYIVNDGDVTTSKLAFKQLVLGIAQKDIEFSGTIKFTGDVEFEGGATGPFPNTGDVYTKQEVDVLLYGLEQYDKGQDDKLNPLVTLSGEPYGTVAYRSFPKAIIADGATTRSALTDLELHSWTNRELISDLNDDLLDKDADVAALDARVDAVEATVNGSTPTSGLVYEVDQVKTSVNDLNDTVNLLNQDKVSADKTSMFNALGYTAAYASEATAALNGVLIGDVYVYSATSSLSNGVLKTNMSTT